MSIKRNFVFNFLLTGSNLLFPLLTFPYLSRIIGAEGLGVCNFILSYGQNFMIVAALGLPVYGVREISKVGHDPLKRSKLFFELLTLHLLFSLVLLLFYTGSIFLSTDLSKYKELALLGGVYMVLNVFSIEWFFTGMNNFKYITIRSLIIRALSVGAIFLFVRGKDDYDVYFLITILTLGSTVITNLNYSRQYLTRKIEFSFKNVLSHSRALIILGFYLVLLNVYSVLPLTFLGFFSTKASVGYYYSANKIIRMIISVFAALTTVMIPKLNMLAENEELEHYRLLLQKSLRIAISFGIPITVFTYLLAGPLVTVLAGKSFYNSIFCIQVMAPIVFLVALAQVTVNLVLSVNRKDKEMVILSIIGMAVSIIINLLFIPKYAEKATAFSQLSAEFLVTLFSFYYARKVLLVKFPLKELVLNLTFTIPFFLLAKFGIILSSVHLLQIIYAFGFCFAFFMTYQLFILRDVMIWDIVRYFLAFVRLKPKKLI